MDNKVIKQIETENNELNNNEIDKSICDITKEDKPKSKSPYNNVFTYVW